MCLVDLNPLAELHLRLGFIVMATSVLDDRFSFAGLFEPLHRQTLVVELAVWKTNFRFENQPSSGAKAYVSIAMKRAG